MVEFSFKAFKQSSSTSPIGEKLLFEWDFLQTCIIRYFSFYIIRTPLSCRTSNFQEFGNYLLCFSSSPYCDQNCFMIGIAVIVWKTFVISRLPPVCFFRTFSTKRSFQYNLQLNTFLRQIYFSNIHKSNGCIRGKKACSQ